MTTIVSSESTENIWVPVRSEHLRVVPTAVGPAVPGGSLVVQARGTLA